MRVVRRSSPRKFTVGLRPIGSSATDPGFLGSKTLLTRPGLEQRAIHGEVVIREQAGGPRSRPHFEEKRLRDVARQEPVSIFAKDGRHLDRVIYTQADEPPEQQVVLQLLHQQPFAAHGVQCLQQQRPQQLLGRD